MAAGQGFKTFTTGEVLTAGDVNGYLMQGVLVFASAAARDAAITSPEEGQFAYLKDTNVTTYYTGSAWTNLDTTGMVNPMTTTGDTIYSSSGSTPARLGIGSTGQVLTVAGGIPSWATPAGAKNYSLLGTGALTSGSTVTVSGISGIDEILVVIGGASNTAGNTQVNLRINGDTAANYRVAQISWVSLSTYGTNVFGSSFVTGNDKIPLGNLNSAATDTISGSVLLMGCNTAGVKPYQYSSGGNSALGNNGYSYSGGGIWNNTSTVTSISVVSSGTFDAGNFYVYGSA